MPASPYNRRADLWPSPHPRAGITDPTVTIDARPHPADCEHLSETGAGRTMTTAGHQSLLMPYYGNGQAQPSARPMPTVPTRDRFALVDLERIIDDCGLRMLEPHEIAAAMAFPAGYIPDTLPKKHRVRLAGNAVTPPVMRWIVGRVVEALGSS